MKDVWLDWTYTGRTIYKLLQLILPTAAHVPMTVLGVSRQQVPIDKRTCPGPTSHM